MHILILTIVSGAVLEISILLKDTPAFRWQRPGIKLMSYSHSNDLTKHYMLHFRIYALILFIIIFWIKPIYATSVKELLKQTYILLLTNADLSCAIFSVLFLAMFFCKTVVSLESCFYSFFTGMRSCVTGMTACFTRRSWDSTMTILRLSRRLRVDNIMRFVFPFFNHFIHFVSFYKHLLQLLFLLSFLLISFINPAFYIYGYDSFI